MLFLISAAENDSPKVICHQLSYNVGAPWREPQEGPLSNKGKNYN